MLIELRLQHPYAAVSANQITLQQASAVLVRAVTVTLKLLTTQVSNIEIKGEPQLSSRLLSELEIRLQLTETARRQRWSTL